MKKHFYPKTAIALVSFLLPISVFAAEAFMPFTDVSQTDYFYTPVQIGLEKKILKSGKYFYPGKQLTRAEFINWVVRALNIPLVEPAKASFSDVPKTFWAYAAIETAKKYGLTAGTKTSTGEFTGRFEPAKNVIRAEAAVMIMKAFLNIPKKSTVKFPDLKGVPWAEDAILKAASVGFFSGHGDGKFRPANNILRGEGITVVRRIIEKVESKELTLTFVPAATTSGITYTPAQLLKKAETALPGYIISNVQQAQSYAVFFAYDPRINDRYGWYRLRIENAAGSQAEKIFGESTDDLFQAAVSPDGKELLTVTSNGEVAVTYISSGVKTDLGKFSIDGIHGTYKYPYYTPDKKYFILFDTISHGLLAVDATLKNIRSGALASGFSEPGSGSTIVHGGDLSYYSFTDNRVRFVDGSTLNLIKMQKE